MLEDREITKFQRLYKNRFGEEISRKEAFKKGINLINLMRIVYCPMTKEKSRQTEAHHKETKNL